MFEKYKQKKEQLKEKKEKLLEEERLNKKYDLQNLFLITVGTSKYIQYGERFYPRNYTIAIYKHDDYHPIYEDIFTNQDYLLFGDTHAITGSQCCLSPTPITSLFKKSELRTKLLRDGFITKRDLIIIYDFFNTDKEEQIDVKPQEPKKKDTKTEILEGKLLNDKKYKVEPAIGRDSEVKELITILASDKKSPILVGPSGTGKTTIVEELVYLIQNNKVPNFLKDQKIIELDTASLVAGTKYVGTLEEKFLKTIKEAKELDAIIFIDEIHTIYGAGSSKNNDNDLAELIKKAIDREGIRVIGTTTDEEYNDYFNNDALKRRFEKIEVNEPTLENLYSIIYKVFKDYEEVTNIKLTNLKTKLDTIISSIIDATKPECRTYIDKVNNPDLAISIIDKAFASAKINDNTELSIEDIIYAIEKCSRIYESVRTRTISSLEKITYKPKVKEYQKVIKFKQ